MLYNNIYKINTNTILHTPKNEESENCLVFAFLPPKNTVKLLLLMLFEANV